MSYLEDMIMKIIYKCERQYPNDIEKRAIEKVFKENISLVAPKEGERIILPHKNGAIFFNKSKDKIDVIDYIFTHNIININE